MASNNDQNEFPVPAAGGSDTKRTSAQHLPRYFRTETNKKFLSSTLDQLIQPGVAEKLNGYFGRQTAKSFTAADNYVGDISTKRSDYQFEPATVIKDDLDNVLFYKDYNDFVNQLTSFGADTSDHSRFNSQEYYAWNPHIDWDKFTNFREYYWLPNGPQTIPVKGQTIDIVSTYTVELADNLDNNAYLFTPDGATQNPSLKLYRGITYRFEINTEGLPFTIRTKRTLDSAFDLDSGISAQNVELGVIELRLTSETPDVLYYVADNDINVAGLIKVANIEEASFIDVETEIVGKKTYTTSDGFALSNGMKVKFIGEVTPATYAEGEFYVDGVGDEIRLIAEADLNVASSFTDDLLIPFDGDGFDRSPFDEAIGYPAVKDYFVINRGSADGNLWSRYNRWFHRSVIEKAAEINGVPVDVDQSQRAKRPIIEFDAGIKLQNFGTKIKKDVDLVDTYTLDVFSDIEGSQGYNIDGIDITDGMRILFLADTDILVKGKIYQVNFITFADGTGRASNRQISLVEVDDSEPLENEVVLVKDGTDSKGLMYYYNGTEWKLCQTKTSVNQAPLFEMFDEAGNSFNDLTIFEASTFKGNKIFSYAVGAGQNDTELGFPITYRNIENVGDITFNFDLLKDSFNYQVGNDLFYKNTDIGYLRKYKTRTQFAYENGWKKSPKISEQVVIRQYVNDNTLTAYDIDVYENSASLTDLWYRVYLNNKLQVEGTDFTTSVSPNNLLQIIFVNDLAIDDVILFKTKSRAAKTEIGHYEISANLERNPLNNNLTQFTLGEVNDHVASIVESLDNFVGKFPGAGNLRDVGPVSIYGKRFLKHSSPFNLASYSLLDKDSNMLKSIRYARREYGKFKRLFLQTANDLGYEGPVKEHVDRILASINKDKISSMPFYFSDMFAIGASVRTDYEIYDEQQQFFALSQPFTLDEPSRRAVQIYINGLQLIHGKDYTFNSEGFAIITATKEIDDVVTIYEYESTNGTYVPPTPTKLGLYPAYEPVKYLDDTYLEPTEIIQGHDGSKFVAYNDFRDDLILELEKRIYNNIKVKYDPTIFDIESYVGGTFRDTTFTKEQIDNAMLPDFVQWLQLVDDDYTDNQFFQRTNSFTFNYASMTDPNGNALPGFWRGVYKQAFDTDRPHTHPWEMLGFKIKPTWWEEQYGPAPYTKDNIVMWEDLQNGVIRIPGQKFSINKKYKRPGLVNFIPVDESGNLLSPNDCGYAGNFVSSTIKDIFKYGDEAPVESAWRRSGEFPFALIASWLLNQPHKVFATGFDRIRQKKNLAGQIIYTETNNHIRLQDLVFPNTVEDTAQIFTAGLINYVAGYMAASVTRPYGTYKDHIVAITNQMGFKVGGFTEKNKFRLILDSRTPLNQGNVFVPDENYKIFLNTSSPVETLSYSGVLIERRTNGFKISGYDNTKPYFDYYKPIALENDPTINVGGITEKYVTWGPGQTYVKGQNIENAGAYYRAKNNFTSGASFDTDNVERMPSLPLIGGRDATFRRTFFTKITEKMPYGTVLKTVQEVVDFLLGYQKFLETKGFVFDYYDSDNAVVANWRTSCKEFLFWTTQNWAAGTVITLSPAAFQLKLQTEYSIVDNIFDNFYGYTLLKADGKKLVEEFTTLGRQNSNEFVLRPKTTADGIYSLKLPLVQKEHVVLLDNRTVFGDVIFDPEPGYRQERIKILGYRTTDWDGSLNIPGFVYDDAKVTDWESWKDYSIGDTVKYKEFYYTATNKIPGTETFESEDWNRLDEKPSPVLLPNFEYKTNQFADFYDLDSDNFDTEQQRLAQHLIGYQKRTYLENIINDDVSQYKFYQGFIADKGSKNALTKLFDALASDDKDSLEFYEEWAIKQGQYGASEGFDEVEFLLDEKQFRLAPQPIELVQRVQGDEKDLIYRIQPYQVYLKPENYDHKPFPSKYITNGYTKDSGYVNPEDVDFIVGTYDDILTINFADCRKDSYIWVGNDKQTWNVYRHIDTDLEVEAVTGGDTEFTVVLTTTPKFINPGDILGVFDLINTTVDPADSTYAAISTTSVALGGFYKVKNISLNRITFETSEPVEDVENCVGKITNLLKVRTDNLETLNSLTQIIADNKSKFWLDNDGNSKWKVVQNSSGFNLLQSFANSSTDTETNFATSIAVNNSNTLMAVGAPDDGSGKVYVYRRGSNNANWQLSQVLEADDDIADELQRFGASVGMSPDGKYLIVGSPDASNVKTNYKSTYSEYGPDGDEITPTNYVANDIVRYENALWRSTTTIQPRVDSIEFTSFDSVEQIINSIGNTAEDSEEIPVILAGNYPIPNIDADHILIRAPLDMYDGSAPNDTLVLEWNTLTIANQNQESFVAREPFDGAYPNISEFFLSDNHTIQNKVDAVLYVNVFTTKPVFGDRVETADAFGFVDYVYENEGQLVLYLRDVNGIFDLNDSLFLANGEFVGEYDRVAPNEEVDSSEAFGGYWRINLNSPVSLTTNLTDSGRGLIYKDVVSDSTVSDRYYYNILDYDTDLTSSENTLNSYFRILSFQGFPGPGGSVDPVLSQKYVIRAPKVLTDTLSPGSTFDFYMPQLTRFSDGSKNDPTLVNLSYEVINKTLTVDELWDGYIFFEFTKFDTDGDPFEPRVGQTVRDVTTGAEAVVEYYQRDGLNVTLFVSGVTGNWSQGDDYGDNAEIEFLGDATDPDPIYQVNRVMGQTQYRSLGLDAAGIGKLIVVDAGVAITNPDFDAGETDRLVDVEYWFFNENTVAGIAREANIPSVDNNDWEEIFSLITSSTGEPSGKTKEGMYSVYATGKSTTFSKVNSYTIPERDDNLRLGYEVQATKYNDLYRGFISAGGSERDTSEVFPGRIYFIKSGTDTDGTVWNWDYAKDKKFKGEFSTLVNYYLDDIVYNDGLVYQADTNIAAGTGFVLSDWNLIEDPLDYLGYVPNDTSLIPSFGEVDISSILDQGSLYHIGSIFDTSDNGEVLITSALYENDKPNLVVVYRSYNGNYQRSQQIAAPSNTIGFGKDIAISNDGMLIAISAPYDDDVRNDQGKVFIYKQVNGIFELTQTLNSRQNEKQEFFGHQVQFDGTTLVVSARSADGELSTTFDGNETVLDAGFTQFKKVFVDSGVVYLYERINDTLVYGQTLDFDDSSTKNFGDYILAKDNHIYVGMPGLYTTESNQGTLIDYRKVQGTNIYNELRVPKDTVDVSKIKRMFLYDTKKQELLTYLDYIDPIQGKIAGPAEQELRYKTYYDPAVFSTGPENLKVDTYRNWGEEQIGQLWWDLTNAKFLNPYQGNIIFSTNNWNKLFVGNSIDVYEWVESDVLPSEWDEIADTEEGIAEGISGQSRYGDSAYVEKRRYDSISQSFTNKYYFWVKGKVTVPDIESRSMSSALVAKLIEDPASQGYKFVNLISENSFVIYNCDNLIKGDDVALSIQYWTIDDQNINIHNQYQILTEGLESSVPSRDIERKWFDSLIGKDDAGRPVPAEDLSPKEKYGILNKPRQGWFVNNAEALKQVITRVNRVLKENLIIDDKDITALQKAAPAPVASTRIYDTAVDSLADLEFVGVAKAEQAVITPVITDGKITRVTIDSPGRGYLVVPTITIEGQGSGAEIELEINSVGAVVNATVVNQGNNYTSNTRITIRRFAVLVNSDETIQGKWALYERISETRQWSRIESQAYDVSLYWDYIDWYDTGYSEFTEVNYLIDNSYELLSLDDTTGDIVKIKTIGTGGWLLLEKIDDADNIDYTVNYKTIGRENGTIQFKNTLYDTTANAVGFDTVSYDIKFFDSQPTTEMRIILEAIRDDLLVDELAIEYNALFFSSLRYVLSEQNYVDWAFKTSFVKAKHNVGTLREDITFNNDNLPSYEEYLNEVKPYKTKLREYLSSYEGLDNSSSVITDFDLPPAYSNRYGKIIPQSVKVVDGTLIGENTDLQTYPNKNWLDNFGYGIASIDVADGGKGYTFPPVIEITGGGGSGAEAIAFLGNEGKISYVKIVKPGSGYLSQPTVTINGSLAEDGEPATLSAKLGDGLVRSMNTSIKFDRITGVFEITKLLETESFAGTGNKYVYNLRYPMELNISNIEVFVNNNLALRSEFTYSNQKDTSKGYDRYYGQIVFTTPPIDGASIVINYKKPVELLHAADRVNLFYNPTTGQFGNDLGQVMDGIDYGGVEVKSFEFGGPAGWDSQDWYSDSWDTYDVSYEDLLFQTKRVDITLPSNVIVSENTTVVQENTTASGRVVADSSGNVVTVESPFNQEFDTVNNLRKYVTLKVPPTDLPISTGTVLVQEGTNAQGRAIQNNLGTQVIVETDITSQFSASEDFTYYTDSTDIGGSNPIIPTDITDYLKLDEALETGLQYNVYKVAYDIDGKELKNVRIDDPNYGTGDPVTNANAVMQSITGDGTSLILPFDSWGVSTSANDEIIIRKSTSDGSFIADPESYDTQYQGGNLAYTSATGLNAEDINVDGDGFVTPTTSKGPEEVIPGQLLDTVDITVYERPVAGGSKIYSRNYVGDGVTTTFKIDQRPQTQSQIIVKLDTSIKNVDEDFTVDYDNETVVFDTAPTAGQRVSIINIEIGGSDILDVQSFESDGSTNTIVTDVRYSENVNFIVSSNGIEIPSVIRESTEEDGIAGNILLDMSEPVKVGDFVSYALYKGQSITDQNFSQVTIDTFDGDGSTVAFELSKAPFSQEPSAYYTIVRINDYILNAGYTKRFTVTSNNQYILDIWQTPVGTLNNQDVEVYLNGRKLTFNDEWTFIGGAAFEPDLPPDEQKGSIIQISPGVSTAGDDLRIYVISDGEYRFGYYETADDSSNSFVSTPGTVYLDQVAEEGDVITVYQFSNNAPLEMERLSYDIVERTKLTQSTEAWYKLRQLRNGLIGLASPATDSKYVWVIKNNALLTPDSDYTVLDNKRYIRLVETLEEDDTIEVIHFAAAPYQNKFGWRQFKDMINRTHYKRLDGEKNYVLKEDLNWYDRTIVLNDAAVDLPAPPPGTRTPGIIWINGERIEYYIKSGNELKQLRRGTLGTGVSSIHVAGTEIYDQSSDSNLPYKDETLTTIFTADGTTSVYELDFNVDDFTFIKNSRPQDLFEVFVAGKRLRKDPVQSYRFEYTDTNGDIISPIAQDSPEGDITLPAEFTVEGNILTLVDTPIENSKVIIIRKQGKRWTDPGTPLSNADTDIGRFLRAKQVDLPR